MGHTNTMHEGGKREKINMKEKMGKLITTEREIEKSERSREKNNR